MTDEIWGTQTPRGSSHSGSGEQGGMVLGSTERIPRGLDPRQKQVRGSLDPSEQLLLPEGAALGKGGCPEDSRPARSRGPPGEEGLQAELREEEAP